MIYSLVWTFQPVLSEAGRQRLDEALRAKYEAARSDPVAYQRERKRKLAERAKQADRVKLEGLTARTRSSGRPGGRGSGLSVQKDSAQGASNLQLGEVQEPSPLKGLAQSRTDGLTPTWTDDFPEKPMLISEFPEQTSFFDCYYSIDAS